MQIDAWGHLLNLNVPETVRCTACDARADRLASAWQGESIAYHNYRCRADGCPAGGTIVERESGAWRRVGPVFRAPRTHHPRRRDDHPAADTPFPADHDNDREQSHDDPLEAHA